MQERPGDWPTVQTFPWLSKCLLGIGLSLMLGVAACGPRDSKEELPDSSATDSSEVVDTTPVTVADQPNEPSLSTSEPAADGVGKSRESITYVGGGYTVTVTGFGADAGYEGCNAQNECLVIPTASAYQDGVYSWENGEYTYTLVPLDGDSYRLQVFQPEGPPLLDETVRPIESLAEADFESDGGAIDYFYDGLFAGGACEGDLTDLTDQDIATYSVNGNQFILEVRCFLAAYQGAYEYWLYRPTASGRQIVPLDFDQFYLDESGQLLQDRSNAIGGLPMYDPAEQILTIFTKYRGVGDCGVLARYQWTGVELAVLDVLEKMQCDGNYVAPENYPQIYP